MARTQSEKAKPPSRTALFEAARRWDVAAVKAMLEAAPALASATDPRGRMALHLACAVTPGSKGLREPDGIKTATALLAAGADLEAAVPMDEDEGDFRATPLWYALSRGRNLPLARFLLKRGADASYSLWTWCSRTTRSRAASSCRCGRGSIFAPMARRRSSLRRGSGGSRRSIF
jgi:Ankyrin repeat